jgi:hypothetical protein
MRMRERIACLAALASVLALATPACSDPALDALVATYPDHIATYVIWRDGSRSPISKRPQRENLRPNARRSRHQGPVRNPLSARHPAQNPGRERRPRGVSRNEALFVKAYGDCRKGEASR